MSSRAFRMGRSPPSAPCTDVPKRTHNAHRISPLKPRFVPAQSGINTCVPFLRRGDPVAKGTRNALAPLSCVFPFWENDPRPRYHELQGKRSEAPQASRPMTQGQAQGVGDVLQARARHGTDCFSAATVHSVLVFVRPQRQANRFVTARPFPTTGVSPSPACPLKRIPAHPCTRPRPLDLGLRYHRIDSSSPLHTGMHQQAPGIGGGGSQMVGHVPGHLTPIACSPCDLHCLHFGEW